MTAQHWQWLLTYCAVVGIPSVLTMLMPVVGVPVGIVAGVWFWRALPKQG
jgi:hypothetical protein